jgi:hypothetical protein
MGDAGATFDLSRLAQRGELLAATSPSAGPPSLDRLRLDPNEGLLLRL